MRKPIYAIAMFFIISISFLAGTWYSKQSPAANPAAAGEQVLHYTCPMHPQYKSDHSGECPICGMRLEAVRAGEADLEAAEEILAPPAGTIRVTADRQQLIGLKVATAEKTSGNKSIRIPGRVVSDETRIFRINSAVDGWVKKILPFTTGSLIKKDDLLANIYAPESASALKAYLFGLRSLDKVRANANESKEQIELSDSTLDNYRNSLRNLGMSEFQMDDIQRTRLATNMIEVRAPESGFLLARNVTLGQRFERGTELFLIADLSHVWILADVFGREASLLKPGTRMRVSLPDRDVMLQARVSEVLPQFDPSTRTMKVRLEADNPGYVLRPNMFVDVQAEVDLPAAITVPSDAVVDTGLHRRVFIDRGNGNFEPREVTTGKRFGDRIEVVEGIAPGERIVIAGTFLIDSESRMKMPVAGISRESAKDPVCGMAMDENKAKEAGKVVSYSGHTYYFCCEDCLRKFNANPGSFLKKKAESM